MKRIIIVGGSTTSGFGNAGFSYAKLVEEFSNVLELEVQIFAKNLITINECLSFLRELNPGSTVVIQLGLGDQLRVLNGVWANLLPPLWRQKGNLNPAPKISDQFYKRIFQYCKERIKYVCKLMFKYSRNYSNTTPVHIYEESILELVHLAKSYNFKIIWINNFRNRFLIPKYQKIEQDYYCREVFKFLEFEMRTNAIYVNLEEILNKNDLLRDGFHPNESGQLKIAEYIIGVL